MPRRLRVASFIAFCAFVALLINWPWETLTAGFALYVAGMLMIEMFDPHADTGPKIIRLLTRGAIASSLT